MQKARRLSAAALWSRSFNPLHLSSLPPPPPPHFTAPSISFLHLPPPPWSSLPRPYFPSPHMLVATQLFFSLWSCLSFFPSSRGQTSPTNPSTCKSARLAKISRLGGEIYDPENAEQRGKRDWSWISGQSPTLFTRRRHLFRQGQQNREF